MFCLQKRKISESNHECFQKKEKLMLLILILLPFCGLKLSEMSFSLTFFSLFLL